MLVLLCCTHDGSCAIILNSAGGPFLRESEAPTPVYLASRGLAQARSIRNVQGHLQRLTRTQAFNQTLSHALCVATFVACNRAVRTPLERSAT